MCTSIIEMLLAYLDKDELTLTKMNAECVRLDGLD